MTEPRKTILIGFAEALAAPEVAFDLHDAGFDLVAFAADKRRCSLARLPFLCIEEVARPSESVADTLAGLGALLERHEIDAVMPLDDVALWCLDGLRNSGVLPSRLEALFAGPDAVAAALDKRRQVDAARDAGMAVPDTLVVEAAGDGADWTHAPCIAKPALAVAEAGGRLVKAPTYFLQTPAEFAAWSRAFEAGLPYLVQPILAGVGEGVFGWRRGETVHGWSGHRRVRMMNPTGSGSSACETRMPEAETRAAVERFLAAIGWQGMFMIEYLRDNAGTLWFMEINGRPWGSMALARRAGFSYPAWTARAAFDPGFEPEVPARPPHLAVRHLGRDLIHLLFVLRGPRSAAHRAGWPSRLSTLWRVLAPQKLERFYNYHPRYRWFFLKESLDTVYGFLFSR